MSALLPGLVDGDDFPSVRGFPPLLGLNAPAPDDDAPAPDDDAPAPDDDNGDDTSDNGDNGSHKGGNRSHRGYDGYHKPAAPAPSEPSKPAEPAAWNGRPACHERGKCGARPSHHRRPGFTGHRPCDHAGHRATRSAQIDRRSAVTERPQNIRTTHAYVNGAGYNSRRSVPEARSSDSRADDNQNRSYRGNHRATGQHHLDRQTPAELRGSRVGRHHADPYDDYVNRQG